MSNYFKILNRLESRRAAGSPAAPRAAAAPGRPPAPSTAGSEAVYTELLNNLRARIRSAELHCVVVAGASAADPVDSVVSGLVGQARLGSLRILVGELALTGERRILRTHGEEPGREVDCMGRPASEVLKEWIGEVGVGYDLILIAAPPVDVSVETALMAKAVDGLVLVVHPFSTPRDELKSAVERAKTAGCPILGLVLNGTREPLPRWLRQILKNVSR